MANLDLSLPGPIPDLDTLLINSRDGSDPAVYALTPVAATQISDICLQCNEAVDQVDIEPIRPAPVEDANKFVGATLRSVLKYHLDRAPRVLDPVSGFSEWDGYFFAVAHSDDWESDGLLLVTAGLDEAARPDVIIVPIEDLASTFLSIQIGNTDWDEHVSEYRRPR